MSPNDVATRPNALAGEALPACGPEWARALRRARVSKRYIASRVGVTEQTLRNLELGLNVSLAIRRVVAFELWLACGGTDPFDDQEV